MLAQLTFDGDAVVVTGCAGGIGAAATRTFVALGAHVVGLDLDEAALGTLRDELGDSFTSVSGDVTDPATTDAVHAAVSACGRPLRALVNNVGWNPKSDFLDLTDETWTAGLDLNLTAAVRMTRTLLPEVKAHPGGNVVMVSSVHGLRGMARSTAYATAKAGLVGLTRQLAADLRADGVRVNVVAPGLTLTERIVARGSSPGQDALRERLLSSRFAEPQEVADAVVFLASDAASYITGVVLPVDGGFTAT